MPAPRTYYLPLPLRWYFLVAQIVALAATLGIVVALIYTMPGTDNSAVVDGRALARRVVLGIHPDSKFGLEDVAHLRRQANTTIVEPPTVSALPSSTAGSLPGTSQSDTNSRASIPPTNSINTSSAAATSMPSLVATTRGAGGPIIVTTTRTTKHKGFFTGLPLPEEGSDFFPGGTNAEPTFPVPTKTGANPSITLSDIWSTSYTIPVGRSSTAHAKTDSTTVTEPLSLTSATPPKSIDVVIRLSTVFPENESTVVTEPLSVTYKAVVTVVSAISTTMTIMATVMPLPQVTTDSVGRTTFITLVPVETVETLAGVYSGQTLTTFHLDYGLTAETRTLTTVVSGSPLTVFIVSTPGRPTTKTVVSVIGATTTTVTPPLVTFVTAFSSAIATTVVRTLAPYVTTTGGTRATITPPPRTFVTVLSNGLLTTVTQTLPPYITITGGTAITTTPPPQTFVTTLSSGVRTTITSTPPPYITTLGGATTTLVQTTTPGRVITALLPTTINGTPTTLTTLTTVTPTPFPSRQISLPGFTTPLYLATTYLPTLLATLLSLLLSTIHTSAQQYQPFHNLATTTTGATAEETLALFSRHHHSITSPFVQVFTRGDAVPLLAALAEWMSLLLAPLAAEAVGFKVHGMCSHLEISGCGIAPGVSPGPAWALVGVLAGLVVVVVGVLLGVVVWGWDTGVKADPWAVVGAAGLVGSGEVRALFEGVREEKELEKRLKGRRFRLGRFAEGGEEEYGIVVTLDGEAPPAPAAVNVKKTHLAHPHMPFMALKKWSRGVFVAVLAAMMAWLAFYFQPLPDTPFELFMDSQGFGVKFLFALLGTVIALFWHSFFEGVAAAGPFALMNRGSRPARQSILASPATNVVSGVLAGVRQRDLLLLVAALMSGVAELLLPAFLANVPFALTLTYEGHVTATAGSLVILGAMLVLLLASLAFEWPHLSVDPRMLGGAFYYVAGSPRLRKDLCRLRLSELPREARDAEVEKLDRLYAYRPLEHDPARMAVEVEGDQNYFESTAGMGGGEGSRLGRTPRREGTDIGGALGIPLLLVGGQDCSSGSERGDDDEDSGAEQFRHGRPPRVTRKMTKDSQRRTL